MILKFRKKKNSLLQQYILFHSNMIIVNTVAWAFFSILIYKETNSFESILYAFLAIFTGLIISFGVTTFTLDRVGYLNSFRVSMFMNAIAAGLFVIFINNIAEVFMFLAFFRGIAQGTFWPIKHSFIVKEVHKHKRTTVINTTMTIQLIIGVFVPILAGSLISFTGGYAATFGIATTMYLLAIIFPFKYNKKSESKIRSSEITRILQRNHIGKFLTLKFLNASMDTTIGIIMAILPFVFLGSEYSVGLLTSAIGIIAAISAFVERDYTEKQRIRLGRIAWFGYAVSNILFAVVWTTPLLVFRSLVIPFLQALGISSRDNIDADLREKILGDFKSESALEMNLITEFVYYISRMVTIVILILLVNVFDDKLDSVLRVSVFIGPLILAILYNAFVKLNKMVRIY